MSQFQESIDYTAQQAHREERSKLSREEQRKRAADVLEVMSTPAGRRLVYRQIEMTGIYRSTFAPGDALQSAFNEGMRNVGLWLLAQVMEHAPTQYALMMKEQSHVD